MSIKKSVPFTLLIQVGSVLLGTALGSCLLVGALIPQLGLGQVERIRQLGLHLEKRATATQASGDEHLVVLLGDSITREGVDAEHLADVWRSMPTAADGTPPARFENWAISGCSLAEQRIQLPKVLEAKPVVVVFALGPSSLCHLPDLPLDKAYAYAYAGFEIDEAAIGMLGVSASAAAALRSERWQQQLHFRSAPKGWLNERLRTTLKGGARNVDRNWTSPYLMTTSVGSNQLQWHLDLIKSWWTPERSGQFEDGAKILSDMVALTTRHGTRAVIVAVPIHPQLSATARPLWSQAWPVVQSITRTHGGVLIDARNTLDAGRFADALHPNGKGRDRYSEFLAAELQAPIVTARK